MKKLDADGNRTVSLEALLRKLRRTIGLMTITEWDADANAAYLELFNVDKRAEVSVRLVASASPLSMTGLHSTYM